jgi:hypothetical protein
MQKSFTMEPEQSDTAESVKQSSVFFFDTRKVSFPLQNGNTTVHKVAENLDVRQKRGKHRVQLKDSEYTMTETSK